MVGEAEEGVRLRTREVGSVNHVGQERENRLSPLAVRHKEPRCGRRLGTAQLFCPDDRVVVTGNLVCLGRVAGLRIFFMVLKPATG